MNSQEYLQLVNTINGTPGDRLVVSQYTGSVLPPIPDRFTNVVIERCTSLSLITQMPSRIESLAIRFCPLLTRVDFDFPDSFANFSIWTCPQVTTVGSFSRATNFNHFWIRDCNLLTSILGFPQRTTQVTIEGCPNLTTLPVEFGRGQVRTISIRRTGLQEIPVFPRGLTSATLDENQLRVIGDIPPTVEILDIQRNPLQVLPIIPPSVRYFYYTLNDALDPELSAGIWNATSDLVDQQERVNAVRNAIVQFWRARKRQVGRNVAGVNQLLSNNTTNTPANWYAGPLRKVKGLSEDVGSVIGSMLSGVTGSLSQQKNTLRQQYERMGRGGARKRKSTRRKRAKSRKNKKHQN